MEYTPEEVDTKGPKGHAKRDIIVSKDIPISLTENDYPTPGGGPLQILRKPGQHRSVGDKAEITVTWKDNPANRVKKITFTPTGYQKNGNNLEYKNLLDTDTKLKTTTQYQYDSETGLNQVQYTAGIASALKGTYYVSILVELKAGNGDAGTDEIFVRFEKEADNPGV